MGKELYEYILSLNLGKVGMAGFMICLFLEDEDKDFETFVNFAENCYSILIYNITMSGRKH